MCCLFLCLALAAEALAPVMVEPRAASTIACERQLFTVPVQLDGATQRLGACRGDDGAGDSGGEDGGAYGRSARRFCAQHGLACDGALRERLRRAVAEAAPAWRWLRAAHAERWGGEGGASGGGGGDGTLCGGDGAADALFCLRFRLDGQPAELAVRDGDAHDSFVTPAAAAAAAAAAASADAPSSALSPGLSSLLAEGLRNCWASLSEQARAGARAPPPPGRGDALRRQQQQQEGQGQWVLIDFSRACAAATGTTPAALRAGSATVLELPPWAWGGIKHWATTTPPVLSPSDLRSACQRAAAGSSGAPEANAAAAAAASASASAARPRRYWLTGLLRTGSEGEAPRRRMLRPPLGGATALLVRRAGQSAAAAVSIFLAALTRTLLPLAVAPPARAATRPGAAVCADSGHNRTGELLLALRRTGAVVLSAVVAGATGVAPVVAAAGAATAPAVRRRQLVLDAGGAAAHEAEERCNAALQLKLRVDDGGGALRSDATAQLQACVALLRQLPSEASGLACPRAFAVQAAAGSRWWQHAVRGSAPLGATSALLCSKSGGAAHGNHLGGSDGPALLACREHRAALVVQELSECLGHGAGQREQRAELLARATGAWGMWAGAAQRPTNLLVRGLHARPWWVGGGAGGSKPPVAVVALQASVRGATAVLEANFAALQQEAVAAAAAGGISLHGDWVVPAAAAGANSAEAARQRGIRAPWRLEPAALHSSASWFELVLVSGGVEQQGGCQLCPLACSLVRDSSAALAPLARAMTWGQVKLSVMERGTRVRPHAGPTNVRLRAHLPLWVPPALDGELELRSGAGTARWREGEALVFDDSFEHEVRWHGPRPRGNAAAAATSDQQQQQQQQQQQLQQQQSSWWRMVLIVDVWHPQLSEAQRALIRNSSSFGAWRGLRDCCPAEWVRGSGRTGCVRQSAHCGFS